MTATSEAGTHAPAVTRSDAPSGLARVRVWDLVVRLTHWVIAVAMAVLAVTGIYLGDPYIVVSGEAGDHFVMGTMRAVHFYAAIAFTLAVLSRILWMFIGTETARWHQLVPTTRARWRDLKETFLFYIWLRKAPPPAVGHNALAGFTYLFVFGLYLVMIASGLGLYAIQADVDSPLRFFEGLLSIFGGVQGARWFHHVVMWLLIGFAVHHLYSAIYMSVIEKNGTIGSIFTGDKWLRRIPSGARGLVLDEAQRSQAKEERGTPGARPSEAIK